jgi:hypothetical protein
VKGNGSEMHLFWEFNRPFFRVSLDYRCWTGGSISISFGTKGVHSLKH